MLMSILNSYRLVKSADNYNRGHLPNRCKTTGLGMIISALFLFSVNVYKKLTENHAKIVNGKICQGALARTVRDLICLTRSFGSHQVGLSFRWLKSFSAWSR